MDYSLKCLNTNVVCELYRNALAKVPHEPKSAIFDGTSDRGSERYIITFERHPDEILYVRIHQGTLRGEVNEDNFSIRIVRPRVTQEPQGGFVNFIKKLFKGA